MTLGTNISAGQLFDLIMPAAFVLSGIISTWVLASARKRFKLPFAFALAVGTLFLPLIIFPLYLAIMLWRKPIGSKLSWRYALPLLYATLTLSAIGVFYYFDSRSADAHLARAVQAKLVEDTQKAIREYRQALAVEDDPHTHKLLAIELAKDSQFSDAVSEFRRAQEGGEPDDSIYYQLGLLFERMNQSEQARIEFRKFLQTRSCAEMDQRCEDARQRLGNSIQL